MAVLLGTVSAIVCLIGLITLTTQQGLNCPQPNGYFADPNDLTAFYQCSQSQGVRLQCADGSLFDRNLGNCIPAEFHVSNHGMVCPEPEGLFQIDGDCSRFLACVGQIAYIMNCPEGTMYNRIVQWCDDPANSTC